MPSKVRGVRESQKDYYVAAIEKRRSLLIDKGVDMARIRKDPQLKPLQARLRQAIRRLGALKSIEKQTEALALRKAQRLEGKPAEQPSGGPDESEKKPTKAKKKEPA